MSLVVLVLLAVTTSVLQTGEATNTNFISGGDNSQLICMIPDPLDNSLSVEEDLRRIGFQPGAPNEVWRPIESSFSRPQIEPLDGVALLLFLAEVTDSNEITFTSVEEPVVESPPLAAGRIVVEVGSGGEEMVFPLEDDAPPTLSPGLIDPDLLPAVQSFIDLFSLGVCTVTPSWTLLSENFFPRYYAGSYCGNGNNEASCSFPAGLSCEPDISTPDRVAYIPILRWDCCWSWVDKSWKWQCGWRRVEIPIIVDCICGCQANLP